MRSLPVWLARLTALGLAAALIPACAANKTKAAPNILNATPASGAAVPASPMVVFVFDRAMDPTFMVPAYFAFVDTGTSANIPFQIEYESAANQVRIVPTQQLTAGHSYNIFASGSVQSAAGTAMGSAEGITVTANPTSVTAAISGFPLMVTASTGTNPGEINLDWSASPGTEQTTTGAPPVVTTISPLPYYDIYVSTTPNGVAYIDSLGDLVPFKTVSTTTYTLTGLQAATVFYIKVVPRDTEGNVFELPLDEATAVSMHN